MVSTTWLLYGANGYTGRLIATLAVQQGLRPILAGRNLLEIQQLAAQLDLPFRTFALTDTSALETALADVSVVLNCAGPFSRTAKAMIAGCLRTQTHYLDITGEPWVLDAIATQHSTAQAAGIMLLPAVGCDVVPSDCLAAYLNAQLPSATHLTLGCNLLLSRMSRGTMITMVEAGGLGGLVRQNGTLTQVPIAAKTRAIDFGEGSLLSTTVPLGDVVTAFYSTNIPNIEVYAAVPRWMYRGLKRSHRLNQLLQLPAVQQFQKWLIRLQQPGPTDAERLTQKTVFWGEVADPAGHHFAARLTCPEGYTLTALTALAITQKVLSGKLTVGFQTPSRVYGADLILEIEGVMRSDVSGQQ